MKKFLGVCLSLVLFASCCGVLVGCGNNYNVNLNLDKYSVNITDAASLGVAQIDGKMKLIKTSKLLLADGTSEPNYTEVEYKDENGNLFDIDKTDLEVYQMYVTPDYTFVSYISQNVRKYGEPIDNVGYISFAEGFDVVSSEGYSMSFYDTSKNVPEDFNTTNYMNNDLISTYIIDNLTGKIYSVEKLFDYYFGSFDIINNLIRINGVNYTDYYSFYTSENDELVFTKIVDNNDITVYNILMDKNGYIYITNNILNTFDAENNTVYTTQNLALGSDGYVYEDNNQAQLCRLNGNSREILSSCDDIVFEDSKYLNQVLDGILYINSQGYIGNIGGLKCYDISNNFTELNAFAEMGFDINSGVIYKLGDDGLYVYNDCDVLNNYLGEATKLLDDCEIVDRYNYLNNGIIATNINIHLFGSLRKM